MLVGVCSNIRNNGVGADLGIFSEGRNNSPGAASIDLTATKVGLITTDILNSLTIFIVIGDCGATFRCHDFNTVCICR